MGPIIVHPMFKHTLQEPPVEHGSRLDSVPGDILLLIAARIQTAQELCVLQRVSRSCRGAANSEELWKRLCMTRFSVPESCTPPSWQQLYRFNHEFLYTVLLSLSAEKFSTGISRPRFGGPGVVGGMGIAINV